MTCGFELVTRNSRFTFPRFQHGFKDTLNPLCTCRAEVETTEHFLLHCQLYFTYRSEIFDKIVQVDPRFLNLIAKDQVLVLLYGSQRNNFANRMEIKSILLLNILNQLVVLKDRYLTVTNESCVFLVKIFVI